MGYYWHDYFWTLFVLFIFCLQFKKKQNSRKNKINLIVHVNQPVHVGADDKEPSSKQNIVLVPSMV